jgi:hypothetical protein
VSRLKRELEGRRHKQRAQDSELTRAHEAAVAAERRAADADADAQRYKVQRRAPRPAGEGGCGGGLGAAGAPAAARLLAGWGGVSAAPPPAVERQRGAGLRPSGIAHLGPRTPAEGWLAPPTRRPPRPQAQSEQRGADLGNARSAATQLQQHLSVANSAREDLRRRLEALEADATSRLAAAKVGFGGGGAGRGQAWQHWEPARAGGAAAGAGAGC